MARLYSSDVRAADWRGGVDQALRDPGDETTGVLLGAAGHPTVGGRHEWRGGRHIRRGSGVRVVVAVMVAVPLLAAAAIMQALPSNVAPRGGGPSSVMGRAPQPGTDPAAGRVPALSAPEGDETPARAGSDAPAFVGPRAATVGPLPVSSVPTAPSSGGGSCCGSWSVPSASPSVSASAGSSPAPAGSVLPSAEPSTTPEAHT